MNIIDRLNSGQMHAAARERRPECVDRKGNIHTTPERAAFVNWLDDARGLYGPDADQWPQIVRDDYARRYVPSH